MKSHNPVQNMFLFRFFVSYADNLSYYAGIMLSAFATYYAHSYAGIIGYNKLMIG